VSEVARGEGPWGGWEREGCSAQNVDAGPSGWVLCSVAGPLTDRGSPPGQTAPSPFTCQHVHAHTPARTHTHSHKLSRFTQTLTSPHKSVTCTHMRVRSLPTFANRIMPPLALLGVATLMLRVCAPGSASGAVEGPSQVSSAMALLGRPSTAIRAPLWAAGRSPPPHPPRLLAPRVLPSRPHLFHIPSSAASAHTRMQDVGP
jgi:hypothetical protein